MKRHVVIQSEQLSKEASSWLGERCELVVHAHDAPGFSARIATADALVVRTYTIVDETLLDAAPRLKVVGRAGVGLDNIDVAACRARHVDVVYTPDANTQAVVEYVLWLVGDAIRPRPALQEGMGPAEWARRRARHVGRRQLDELTIGVLGLGRVGRAVAAAFTGLGAKVIFNDLLDIPAADRGGAEPVPVDELFGSSDVLSIHVDGRAENCGFVGSRLLQAMRDDAIVINTSRGFVVDNAALASCLQSRPQTLALLDVHDPEPVPTDHPLLPVPNARLYPHLASRTETALRNMSWVVRDVARVLEGRAPEFPAPMK